MSGINQFPPCRPKHRCREYSVPINLPRRGSLHEQSLKELGVCRKGGRLMFCADPKRAAQALAKLGEFKTDSIGRSMSKVKKAGKKDEGWVNKAKKHWLKIVVGLAAVVVGIVALVMWLKRRGGDDSSDGYQDDGKVIRIFRKEKVMATIKGWQAEVFRQAIKPATFKAIREAVQTQYGKVKTEEIKQQFDIFVGDEWIKWVEQDQDGVDVFQVSIPQGTVTESTPDESPPAKVEEEKPAGPVPSLEETKKMLNSHGVPSDDVLNMMDEAKYDPKEFARLAEEYLAQRKAEPVQDVAEQQDSVVRREVPPVVKRVPTVPEVKDAHVKPDLDSVLKKAYEGALYSGLIREVWEGVVNDIVKAQLEGTDEERLFHAKALFVSYDSSPGLSSVPSSFPKSCT